VRRSILAAALIALVLSPLAAASFDWPPSRVAAVRAVIYSVEEHFPIMKNPAYSKGRDGIEVTCVRRAAARYACRWRATNTYSIVRGTAGVRFARHRASVALRVTLCLRYKASKNTGAVVSRCAIH
jgi:hypothetical protein